MNIRVDLNTPIRDGLEVVFRSPVDCSQVTGLIVYYDGGNASQEFVFADAHGNNVGDIDHLFAENVVVKVILDGATSMAFVQNADTNAYLEGRFGRIEDAIQTAEVTDPNIHAKYFDITEDGIVSLKDKYRGACSASNYTYAISNNGPNVAGSENAKLPENLIVPDVIDRTAVSGFQEGTFAFNNRLKEITIPRAVEELPKSLCANARNLKAIHNTEHIKKIGLQLIMNTQVEKAIFPNLQEPIRKAFAAANYLYVADIGNNITEIPEQMFAYCPLLSLVNGGGKVSKIGPEAFSITNNLKNLPFLSQVTYIDEMAFYKSRIQFDWSTLDGKCDFKPRATPVMDNTTDYWTGVEYKPCDNGVVTMMSQNNPAWKDKYFGNSGKKYSAGCAVFTILHIHSALSGKTYTDPDEFADELVEIGSQWITAEYHPAIFANSVAMLRALKYKVTPYQSAITQQTYQDICDALKRGAYIFTEISTTTSVNDGHAVCIYGINEIGEVLVLDSDTKHADYVAFGADDVFTYRMPFQNLTGPNSEIIIVEKNV